jgi:hypothetical protein
MIRPGRREHSAGGPRGAVPEGVSSLVLGAHGKTMAQAVDIASPG